MHYWFSMFFYIRSIFWVVWLSGWKSLSLSLSDLLPTGQLKSGADTVRIIGVCRYSIYVYVWNGFFHVHCPAHILLCAHCDNDNFSLIHCLNMTDRNHFNCTKVCVQHHAHVDLSVVLILSLSPPFHCSISFLPLYLRAWFSFFFFVSSLNSVAICLVPFHSLFPLLKLYMQHATAEYTFSCAKSWLLI